MIDTENYTLCPRYRSTNLIRQTGKDEPTSQYGRLKCGDCVKFVKWLQDPSVTLQWNARANAIDKIFERSDRYITNWEAIFLN